jgi:hypothetical protein
MYDVARFVKPKREDWDNGCHEPTDTADDAAFRYAREAIAGEAVRGALKMGIVDCPNIGCHANYNRRCCAGAVCDAVRPNAEHHPRAVASRGGCSCSQSESTKGE